MANQEHLDVLELGVDVWNKWREEHPDIHPDLIEADLRRTHFALHHLIPIPSRTDPKSFELRSILTFDPLRSASLSGANFIEANLREANLFNADLRGADFRGAGLVGVHLRYANLEEANLRGADLRGADLRGADLNHSDFSRALIGHTGFGGVDLSAVKGLETLRHDLPSVIGIDTIYRSRGKIPVSFLRKVGVPETFITNMRALVESMSPIDFYSCFISYSSQDQAFAERLYVDLQSKGVRCWFAPEDLKIGARIRPSIDESIHLYDKLLLVLSQHSLASQWVEQEVETALEKERKKRGTVLFPLRLDNAVMEIEGGWPALIRNTRNIGDFTRWERHDAYQRALDQLLRDLKAEA